MSMIKNLLMPAVAVFALSSVACFAAEGENKTTDAQESAKETSETKTEVVKKTQADGSTATTVKTETKKEEKTKTEGDKEEEKSKEEKK